MQLRHQVDHLRRLFVGWARVANCWPPVPELVDPDDDDDDMQDGYLQPNARSSYDVLLHILATRHYTRQYILYSPPSWPDLDREILDEMEEVD